MDNVLQWLAQEPAENEIATNKDGSQFIPIARVESLLDELTDKAWGTENFQVSLKEWGTTLLVSASVELKVVFANQEGEYDVRRILVGAVTFTDMDYAGNLDFAGTALSEAIKNAAKKLGPRFGKNLNGRGEIKEERQGKQSVKLTPDKTIRAQYAQAIANQWDAKVRNLESIYNFENAS